MPDQPTPDKTLRLQKFLSQAGVCSRRKGEELMAAGRVSVNGAVVKELGARIDPENDRVTVDDKPVLMDDPPVYIALNKPRGVITTLDDPEDRAKVVDLLPDGLPRTWPVGRLDWESEGLLLMTNDGRLTHLLTHPSTCVEKTYTVKVAGHLDPHDDRIEKMRAGVTLDDGFETSAAEIHFEGVTGKNTWLAVILNEGHNRQIRRMCMAVHLDVVRLRRISIGPLELEPLRPGHYRFLSIDEVSALYAAANESPPDSLKAYSPTRLTDRFAPPRPTRAAAASGRNPGRKGASAHPTEPADEPRDKRRPAPRDGAAPASARPGRDGAAPAPTGKTDRAPRRGKRREDAAAPGKPRSRDDARGGRPAPPDRGPKGAPPKQRGRGPNQGRR